MSVRDGPGGLAVTVMVHLVSYPSVIAAALSGASVRQLAYWRAAKTAEPLLAPAYRTPAKVAYSFQDVVALRTFVYLRSREVPLQRVRKAVDKLRELGQRDHLAAYRLVAVGKDVVWVTGDEAVELTGRPGQELIADMVDILEAFPTARGEVLPLYRPKPGVSVDPEVRGGYPVIAGTRVPYNLVSSLIEDGMSAEAVTSIYPSVSIDALPDAVEFAAYVRTYGRGA